MHANEAKVQAIIDGHIDVVLFMTAVQVIHLFQVAEQMKLAPALLRALQASVVLSIGPTTSGWSWMKVRVPIDP